MSFRPSSVAWALCLLGLLSVAGLYMAMPEKTADNSVISSDIGGSFELVNQDGQKVTEKSWPNQYLLLYFGFTHCPDVCPTGLNKIAEALKSMPEDKAARIQPVFITVDPARDEAADLREYVGLFHPELVGLTGTEEQIEAVKATFRVYAQKQGTGDDYMVNHSSFTYLLDPNGSLIGLYSHETNAEDMSKQIIQSIK